MSRYVDLEAALRIVKAEWMRVRDDTVPGDIALQMVEQEIRALPTVDVDVDALREALRGLVYEITHLSAREVATLPRGLRAEVYRCAVDASKVDDARATLARLREQEPAPDDLVVPSIKMFPQDASFPEPAPKCDGPALYTTCDGRSVCTYHANLWDHASTRHDSWAIAKPDPERKCDGGAS